MLDHNKSITVLLVGKKRKGILKEDRIVCSSGRRLECHVCITKGT